jgi:hypothetical protein
MLQHTKMCLRQFKIHIYISFPATRLFLQEWTTLAMKDSRKNVLYTKYSKKIIESSAVGTQNKSNLTLVDYLTKVEQGS